MIACLISVGHAGPTPAKWRDRRSPSLTVCDRHRDQYDERADDLGPFTWEPITEAEASQ